MTAENYDTIRWVGPFAGVFFLLTAIPTFIWLRERGSRKDLPEGQSLFRAGVQRLQTTWREMHYFRDLRSLLVSIFFAMAGIYIIISFSFIYGSQVIGWDEEVRVLMFVIVQITAAVGAIGFGFIQSHIGARTTYIITLLLWLVAILAIWQTPSLTAVMHKWLGVEWQAQYVFLFAGVLSGLSLGSSQSAGRALVGILTPQGKSAEFFGFWGMSANWRLFRYFRAGADPVGVWSGRCDTLCLALFVMAIITLLPVNEQRGEQAADAWQDRDASE